MRALLLLCLVVCTRDAEPPAPPAPAPSPRPVPPMPVPSTIDAPVADAPSPSPDAALDAGEASDAATARRLLTLVPVEYPLLTRIESPGLPAIDRTTGALVVAFREEGPLGAYPNLAIHTLRATDARTLTKLPVWTQDESRARLGDEPWEPKVAALHAAIEAKLTAAEARLAHVEPLVACTEDPAAPAADPDAPDADWTPYCHGRAAWRCGDHTLRYTRRAHQLELTRGRTTRRISTRGWRRPPARGLDGERIETLNCPAAMHRIPDSRRVLIELHHVCDVSGDWCDAGDPTFHVVELP